MKPINMNNSGTINPPMPSGELIELPAQEVQPEVITQLNDAVTASWEETLGVKPESQPPADLLTLPEKFRLDQAYAKIRERDKFLIGNMDSLANFQEPKIAEPESALVEAVENPIELEVHPKFEEDSSLIDFGLFFNTVGEEVFPKASKVASGILSLLGEFLSEAYKLIPEYIVFKLEKKDDKGKDEAKQKKEQQKQVKKQNVQEIIAQDKATLAKQQRTDQNRRAYAAKRLGLNESYEGVMVDGVIRADLEQELQRKEAQEEEDKKKQEKQAKARSTAASGKKGGKPGQQVDDMNLATEKQSHWSKAIG